MNDNKQYIAIENITAFTPLITSRLSEHGFQFGHIVTRKTFFDVFIWFIKIIFSKEKVFHYLYSDYIWFFYLIPRFLGKKVIMHWIGDDVMHLTNLKKNNKRWWRIKVFLFNKINFHVTVAPHLFKELQLAGIESKVVPLIPNYENSICYDLPQQPKVFVYLPEKSFDFYKGKLILKLVEEFSHVEFIITKNSGANLPNLPNIKYYEWVEDIEEVWSQITIYLRLTTHDGLSHLVLEALERGKHVIWSQEFPTCYYATNYDEAKIALQKALQQTKINVSGIDLIKNEYNIEKLTNNFVELYTSVFK